MTHGTAIDDIQAFNLPASHAELAMWSTTMLPAYERAIKEFDRVTKELEEERAAHALTREDRDKVIRELEEEQLVHALTRKDRDKVIREVEEEEAAHALTREDRDKVIRELEEERAAKAEMKIEIQRRNHVIGCLASGISICNVPKFNPDNV
jgi:SPX domain protein involved in polyphosphate accumulation